MKKQDFVEVMHPVARYYGRELTNELTLIYFELVKKLTRPTFEALVWKHMQDPDQGQFFPTFAHLSNQASNAKDVKRKAGLEFDDNPRIDGTTTFQEQHESVFDRQERRRRYIDRRLEDFSALTALQRIQVSNILEHEDVKRIEAVK